MASIKYKISSFSNLQTKSLETVPNVPIPLGSPSPSYSTAFLVLNASVSLYTFFDFPSVHSCNEKIQYMASSLLLFIITKFGFLVGNWGSDNISKPQRNVCASMSRMGICLYINYLFKCSNFNILHSSQ